MCDYHDYYTSDGSEMEDDYSASDQEEGSFDEVEDVEFEDQRNQSRAPSSKVITKESLLAAQREDLRVVMELLSVREHQARTLLIHYRWDVEKLIAIYIEKGKSSMFSEVGVTLVENLDHDRPEGSSTVMCGVCMDDVRSDDLIKTDCGHCFCNTCCTEHFIVKIKEGQSKRIRCMAHKCNAICDEAIVRKLVGANHPHLAEKFERFLLESYIEDNRMIKWCPSVPHCGNAIRVEDDEPREVECLCGLQFCFGCLSSAHSPCPCSMWELWAKKCRDESETVNWMTANTKPCPKCQKPIEKNRGCNHVSCVCGQAFCWLCGAATGYKHTYREIANHSCGRYMVDCKNKADRAKRQLRRYLHYQNRYKAHIDSSKIESKLMDITKEKVSHLESRQFKYMDFGWVTNGLHRLFSSRRALSYSYPFAYYMFGEDLFGDEMTEKERVIKQNLFEDQQQQLESNVEKLSKLLEMPLDEYSDERITHIRMEVINLTAIVDDLCRKMYECIENDLLGSLQFTNYNIAPYNSKGVEKVEELVFELGGEPVK